MGRSSLASNPIAVLLAAQIQQVQPTQRCYNTGHWGHIGCLRSVEGHCQLFFWSSGEDMMCHREAVGEPIEMASLHTINLASTCIARGQPNFVRPLEDHDCAKRVPKL